MDFNFNVNVQIDVTPRLEAFISSLLQARPMAETPEAQPTEAVATETLPAEVQPARELTEVDVRAAMHRTRQRFEGEDYKDNAGSELYQKYHRPLTGMFKQIATMLGADKPSELAPDKIAAFISLCDELILDENGFITAPPAPF